MCVSVSERCAYLVIIALHLSQVLKLLDVQTGHRAKLLTFHDEEIRSKYNTSLKLLLKKKEDEEERTSFIGKKEHRIATLFTHCS